MTGVGWYRKMVEERRRGLYVDMVKHSSNDRSGSVQRSGYGLQE